MSLTLRAIAKALQEAGVPNANHYDIQDEYVGIFPIDRKIQDDLPFLAIIEHNPLANIRPPINLRASRSTGLINRDPATIRLLDYSSTWLNQTRPYPTSA